MDDETTVAPGSEAAMDLRALERMAGEDPGAQPDPEAVAAELARPSLDEEIAGALKLLSKVIAPMFPTVAAVYSDDACNAVGAAVAPVCDKHGWLQGGMAGEWGPEIMCLVVVGPMAYATYTAVQGDLAAMAAKKRTEADRKGLSQEARQIAPERPQEPPGGFRVPGSDTVTFGAPVAQ